MNSLMEVRLREIAAELDFPQTPGIAHTVSQRLESRARPVGTPLTTQLLVGAATLLLVLAVITVAVPQVRAAVLEFFQIGAVRIEIDDEPPTGSESSPASSQLSQRRADWYDEISLEEAAAAANFPLMLPNYPMDIGLPDELYLQTLADPGQNGQVLILDWLNPDTADEPYLSLYLIGVPFYGVKQAFIDSIMETTVQNQPAFWLPGTHQLSLQGPEGAQLLTVARNVLLWTDGVVTYRLESDLSMEEAVRIAESLESLK